ncbi:MAG: aminopeptidase P N-terminal domain-containing protein [Phycisphaerae bacterium]|nr:aminopeptidase P N-terminal domain-containing protein [Phycisphaerae bacterium]
MAGVANGTSVPVITARRARAATAWRDLDGIVVVGAGQPISIPGGQDQTYPFRGHADYRWLTGRERPGGVVAFDPADGWVDFVAEVTESERVWEGIEPDDAAGTQPLAGCAAWIERRTSRKLAALGVPHEGVRGDLDLTRRAAELLLHARRPKDAGELALVRRAIAATAAGFAAARAATRPGVTERAVQIELEAAMFRAGADDVGYSTLVGSGPNSSVLHFAPSSRVICDDDLVLIDAGGAICGYTADVTRTFAASGRFTPERKDLFDVVLDAKGQAIEQCRIGAAWREVHTTAALALSEGLTSMGLVRGSAESFVEREAIALFFPHGIGHMVGLGVRDAGGRLPGVPVLGKCCGVSLRVDLPLAADYLMTVEPGLYFIGALLRDPARRERFADCLHWTKVDQLLAMGIGGVRIEDNVLVGSGAPEILTAAIPV